MVVPMEMYLTSVQSIVIFIFTTFWFIISAFLALLVPGRLILRSLFKNETSVFRKFVMYTGFGSVLWIFQAFLFGYMQMRWLTYIYIVLSSLLSCSFFQSVFVRGKSYVSDLLSGEKEIGVIISLGMIVQCFAMIPSGFIFPNGWYDVIADDAMWHLGLTSELMRRFPPQQPGLSGVLLHNYHYASNLFNAEFIRVFHLPLLGMQFIYGYVLFSFLFGGIIYCIAKEARFSRLGTALAVFFGYFSSDIIYLIPLVTRKTLDFSVHPLEDMTMMFENPPRAWSFVVTLLGFLFLLCYVKTKQRILAIVSGLTFGIVIACKVHTGIMVLSGLALFGLYVILIKKYSMLVVPLIACTISALLYIPVNAGVGGPIYAPFEMARMFIVQPKLNLGFLELRRQIYFAHNNILRIWELNIISLLLFLIGQFGLRNLGWFGLKNAIKSYSIPVTIFLSGALLGTMILGTFFIQPLTWSDIFNSYLAGSLVLFIFSITVINRWVTRTKGIFQILICCVVLLLPLPRLMYRIQTHLRAVSPIITVEEIKTMQYLQLHSKPQDVIMVFNHQSSIDGYFAFVTAFTRRDTFVSGRQIIKNFGIPVDEKMRFMTDFDIMDPENIRQSLDKYHIRFLYFYGNKMLPEEILRIGIRPFYRGKEQTIYIYEPK